MHEIDIMDIGGFKIGQAEDTKGLTGCTVFLFDKQSPAGVDIRGGGPASRETPLLNPVADAKGIHALVLSGGSAFGLDAAGGVMKYLEERDIGFDVGVTKVPLVVQSCIFDLVIGDKNARPDGKMAYKACENASYDTFLQGNYVTLTNMSDHDIDRIIHYHLGPINISFHTTNPELRCKMLHNRFAGDIFPKVQRLYEAGIEMNGQIVLCKGLNDGKEL